MRGVITQGNHPINTQSALCNDLGGGLPITQCDVPCYMWLVFCAFCLAANAVSDKSQAVNQIDSGKKFYHNVDVVLLFSDVDKMLNCVDECSPDEAKQGTVSFPPLTIYCFFLDVRIEINVDDWSQEEEEKAMNINSGVCLCHIFHSTCICRTTSKSDKPASVQSAYEICI